MCVYLLDVRTESDVDVFCIAIADRLLWRDRT